MKPERDDIKDNFFSSLLNIQKITSNAFESHSNGHVLKQKNLSWAELF